MNGQRENIWEILGIRPTEDKRAIRRAYAQACRTCHPEDQPEEFRQLHQAYEQALTWAKAQKEEPAEAGGENLWQNEKKGTDKKDRESIESGESAPPSEHWEELLQGETGETEEKPAASPALPRSMQRWEELLLMGMEEDAALPPPPDPLSWQSVDPTQVSSQVLTDFGKLLEQMKLLEIYVRDNPPQDESAWHQIMERWDLLADSPMFRMLGEKPAYFQLLFGWLNRERGRLHIPTIVGILRIYQINRRIIGHPWKRRIYERMIPELRILVYELIFYESIWDAELFREKLNLYGDRKKRK